MRREFPAAMRGFTLIEILVVVVILGIASAIVVPQIGSRDDLRVSSAARMVVADLIYAQNMAITHQTNHYLVFSGQNYGVVTTPSGSPITHPISKEPYLVRFGPGGTPGARECTVGAVEFIGQSSGNAYTTLGFDDLGTPLVYTGAGPAETLTSGRIVLRCGTHQLVVHIVPFTGELQITEN